MKLVEELNKIKVDYENKLGELKTSFEEFRKRQSEELEAKALELQGIEDQLTKEYQQNVDNTLEKADSLLQK